MPRPTTPLIAADTIIELKDRPDYPIVLIERKNTPFGWAIPGGFVDIGERLEQAAVREAKEETRLDVQLTTLLGIYSDPSRDSRGHTVTAVYVGHAVGTPEAADDAKNIMLVASEQSPNPLAFDHALILKDYWRYRKTGDITPLRLDRF